MCCVSAPFVGQHRHAETEEQTNLRTSLPPQPTAAPVTLPAPAPPVPAAPPPPQKRVGQDGKERALPVKPARVDHVRYPIPASVLPLWDDAEEVRGQVAALTSLRGMLTRAEEGKSPMYAEINFSVIKAALNQAIADWERAVPFAVCPTCSGESARATCGTCHSRGFVSEFFWKNLVDIDTRKLRESAVK
jgi:hypothetical protein